MSSGKSEKRRDRVRRGPTFRIREAIPGPLAWVLGVIPPLVLLAGWWFVTHPRDPDLPVESRIVSPVVLPSPGETAASFHSLWFERELSRNTVESLKRVAGGYLVAVALALPLGVMMGSLTKVKAMFNPLAVVGAYVPLPAVAFVLFPVAGQLALLLHADGLELYKYAYLAVVTFVVFLPQVVLAIENVDNVFLQTAYTQGAGRWQSVWRVLVPVAMPEIFTALRVSFAVGWTYIILAEAVAADRGLGFLLITSLRRTKFDHILLIVAAIMVVGFVIDKVWARIGRWLLPYHTVT